MSTETVYIHIYIYICVYLCIPVYTYIFMPYVVKKNTYCNHRIEGQLTMPSSNALKSLRERYWNGSLYHPDDNLLVTCYNSYPLVSATVRTPCTQVAQLEQKNTKQHIICHGQH